MFLDTPTELSSPTQVQTYLRPLGSFEELLWQMDKRSPLHFTLAAHVDGSTTVEEWRKALEQARRRHPLWSARIAQAEDGAPFFEQMLTPRVELRVVTQGSVEGWENEMARELSVRFDAVNGPLVRAALVHTEQSSMLILSAHHSICDGMSLAFALRDVLQAVSGSKLKALSLHASEEDALGLDSQARGPIQNAERRTDLPPASSVYRSEVSIVPEVTSLQLSSGLTNALRSRARQEETTVHAAIVAAAGIAARGNASYASGRDLHICSTINNRGLMDSPEDSCVLFTACDFPLAVSPMEDLWELATQSKQVLRAAQSEEGVSAVLGAVDRVAKAGLDEYSAGEEGGKLFQFDIHLSNLGAVNIPSAYGDLSLRQLWGPGVLVGYEGEQTLGISTLNGRLCLLHTSHKPLPRYLEDIGSLLTTAGNR